ncbi:hypothetical protein Tco_0962422 [Tanacetum coccineum]
MFTIRLNPRAQWQKVMLKAEWSSLFCSRYFEGVETPFNRPPRNDETIHGKEIELQALKKGPVDLKTIEKLVVEEFSGWLQLQASVPRKDNFDNEVFCKETGLKSWLNDEDEDEDENENDEESKEVEIVDEYGSILRVQNMTAKDVYKLTEGEKVLVHVNDLFQLIKGAAVRYTKHRFKMKLFRLAAKKLDEANNVGDNGEQERTYTDDELLQALDLIDAPPNFLHHQWELYKSNLRTPLAKKLSEQEKKAKSMQVHTHTTGATSFARKRDRFVKKLDSQGRRIESQNNQIKTMAKDLSDIRGELKVLTTAFKELYVAGASKDMLFQETSEDVQDEQQQQQHQHNLNNLWQSLWQSSMQTPPGVQNQNQQVSSQGQATRQQQ